MKQLTVRGVSPELSRRLETMSKQRGTSVNALVLEILSSAAGVDERRERLRRYTTWTPDDVGEFERALAEQRVVDEDLWR